jgi:hypothetical protein
MPLPYEISMANLNLNLQQIYKRRKFIAYILTLQEITIAFAIRNFNGKSMSKFTTNLPAE